MKSLSKRSKTRKSILLTLAIVMSPFSSSQAHAVACLNWTPAIETSPYMPINSLNYHYVYLGPPAGGSCGTQIMHGNYITTPYAQIMRINNNCTHVSVAATFCQGWNCPYTVYITTPEKDFWAQYAYLPGWSILGSWYKAKLNPFPDINVVSCFARRAV